jgi:hypothetical protein
VKYSIELTDEQIIQIHKYFEQQCMFEYISENHQDWSSEKIEFVSERAYEILMEMEENSENETYAIDSALDEWEALHDM